MAPTTFSATITDIRLESRKGTAARWQIALDYTLFSTASSTGTLIAIAPSGARLEVPVLAVKKRRESSGTSLPSLSPTAPKCLPLSQSS